MAQGPGNWYAPPAAPIATAPPPEQAVERAEYAGFGVRVVGRIIDTFVGGVLGGIGGAVGARIAVLLVERPGMSLVEAAGATHALRSTTLPSLVLTTLAGVAYHALSEGFGGATLGKLALGLRVRRADLRPCTIGPAIGRSFAYFLDAFFFGIPAYGSMSRSRQQQRYGDRWAGTVVVKAASLSPSSATSNVGLGILLGVIACVLLTIAGTVSKVLF
jgi:uncharacterized RDD family membrane protein YckC